LIVSRLKKDTFGRHPPKARAAVRETIVRTARRVADAAITPPVWKGFRSEKQCEEKFRRRENQKDDPLRNLALRDAYFSTA
jgi:hypothetical protein